jgi:hypothetical protein
MTLASGLALALASAVALNWGWVAQHAAAGALPPLTLRHPVRSLLSLLRDRAWLTGVAVGTGGWAFYIAALAFAPLSLVQATSAGGMGVLAFLARRRGARLSRAQWAAVAIAGAGLVLLGVSLAGGTAAAAHASWVAVAVWLGVSAAVAALAAIPGSLVLAGGAGLGVASGVLYAAGDVATKTVVDGGGWWRIGGFVAALLAAHSTAAVCLQFGFQRGDALATAGTSTLLTNAVPIAAGVVLFSERLPGGALGAIRVLAFVCVIAAAGLLARRAPPLEALSS